jgi:hypothetical protein
VIPPVSIEGKSLVLRAAAGLRPVLELDAKGLQADSPLILTRSALVLEGLELRRLAHRVRHQTPRQHIVLSVGAPALYAANCRFVGNPTTCLEPYRAPNFEARNCEFLCDKGAIGWAFRATGHFEVENCVHGAGIGSIWLTLIDPNSSDVSVRLRRNTLLAERVLNLQVQLIPRLAGGANPAIQLDASQNVFDSPRVMLFQPTEDFVERTKGALTLAEAEALLRRLVAWREQRNLYAVGESYLRLGYHEQNSLHGEDRLKTAADWKQFWGSANLEMLEGRPLYDGGYLRGKAASAPETLSPADFRLAPGSPGKGAGQGGRDLGADVDLVGPGPAYERWKRTPEYQDWRQRTAQAINSQ